MGVYNDEINVSTKGEVDIIDITDDIQNIINKSKLKEGIICVFVSGSTATITTIEYEPGIIHDFPKVLDKIAPKNKEYKHHETWHDDNGRSHVKSSLMGSHLVIPFQNKTIIHGTWQQLMFMELDTSPRQRKLIVQLVGE